MSGQFKSRKEQIEKDFLKSLLRRMKEAGCVINEKGELLIKEELKSAAMVGAYEERSRILKIVAAHNGDVAIRHAITAEHTLKVLGYED